ncbi:MAG: hypothetical protein NTW30_03985 [Candidatus Aenigmarchaeota archaeon]|nr:hypothetical protein [Candidatus Aenigmarchaeota archaeon]
MEKPIDWEKIARRLLDTEKAEQPYHVPKSTGVIVEWKGGKYIGSIHQSYLEYTPVSH